MGFGIIWAYPHREYYLHFLLSAYLFLQSFAIIILDEATSTLDNRVEAIVQKAINNLMQDKTLFVIAYRLSTIRITDKINVKCLNL